MTIYRIILTIIEAFGALWALKQLIKAEIKDKTIFYIFTIIMCIVAIFINLSHI